MGNRATSRTVLLTAAEPHLETLPDVYSSTFPQTKHLPPLRGQHAKTTSKHHLCRDAPNPSLHPRVPASPRTCGHCQVTFPPASLPRSTGSSPAQGAAMCPSRRDTDRSFPSPSPGAPRSHRQPRATARLRSRRDARGRPGVRGGRAVPTLTHLRCRPRSRPRRISVPWLCP